MALQLVPFMAVSILAGWIIHAGKQFKLLDIAVSVLKGKRPATSALFELQPARFCSDQSALTFFAVFAGHFE